MPRKAWSSGVTASTLTAAIGGGRTSAQTVVHLLKRNEYDHLDAVLTGSTDDELKSVLLANAGTLLGILSSRSTATAGGIPVDFLVRALPLALIYMDLQFSNFTGRAGVGRLKCLTALRLDACPIRPAALCALLRSVKSLRALSVRGCTLLNSQLSKEELQASQTASSSHKHENWIDEACNLPQLSWLDLSAPTITLTDVRARWSALSRLPAGGLRLDPSLEQRLRQARAGGYVHDAQSVSVMKRRELDGAAELLGVEHPPSMRVEVLRELVHATGEKRQHDAQLAGLLADSETAHKAALTVIICEAESRVVARYGQGSREVEDVRVFMAQLATARGLLATARGVKSEVGDAGAASPLAGSGPGLAGASIDAAITPPSLSSSSGKPNATTSPQGDPFAFYLSPTQAQAEARGSPSDNEGVRVEDSALRFLSMGHAVTHGDGTVDKKAGNDASVVSSLGLGALKRSLLGLGAEGLSICAGVITPPEGNGSCSGAEGDGPLGGMPTPATTAVPSPAECGLDFCLDGLEDNASPAPATAPVLDSAGVAFARKSEAGAGSLVVALSHFSQGGTATQLLGGMCMGDATMEESEVEAAMTQVIPIPQALRAGLTSRKRGPGPSEDEGVAKRAMLASEGTGDAVVADGEKGQLEMQVVVEEGGEGEGEAGVWLSAAARAAADADAARPSGTRVARALRFDVTAPAAVSTASRQGQAALPFVTAGPTVRSRLLQAKVAALSTVPIPLPIPTPLKSGSTGTGNVARQAALMLPPPVAVPRTAPIPSGSGSVSKQWFRPGAIGERLEMSRGRQRADLGYMAAVSRAANQAVGLPDARPSAYSPLSIVRPGVPYGRAVPTSRERGLSPRGSGLIAPGMVADRYPDPSGRATSMSGLSTPEYADALALQTRLARLEQVLTAALAGKGLLPGGAAWVREQSINGSPGGAGLALRLSDGMLLKCGANGKPIVFEMHRARVDLLRAGLRDLQVRLEQSAAAQNAARAVHATLLGVFRTSRERVSTAPPLSPVRSAFLSAKMSTSARRFDGRRADVPVETPSSRLGPGMQLVFDTPQAEKTETAGVPGVLVAS